MPQYKCTVQKANGKLMKRLNIHADNDANLMKLIKEKELFLINYIVIQEEKDILNRTKGISTKNLSLFCRQMSSMLTAGITLIRALNILYQQVENKSLKNTIKLLYESVQRGDQFSEALRKQKHVFPELMISMVESGEASGRLDTVMQKLADNYEKDHKLQTKIRSALVYPIILSVIALGVILLLITVVLPTFTGMFTSMGVDLPLPTKILLAFGKVITGYWYIIIFLAILLVVAFRTYINTPKGKLVWDDLLLKIPIFKSTITKIAAVRFSRTLSTLLASGITLLQSLDIVIKVVGNQVIMNSLQETKEDIRKGLTLSQSLRKVTLLPPMIHSMIGIGEESGNIEEMLDKTADFFDGEVDTAIQRLISLMEPIMIVCMGVIVAFIIISVLLPMFEVYSMMG